MVNLMPYTLSLYIFVLFKILNLEKSWPKLPWYLYQAWMDALFRD